MRSRLCVLLAVAAVPLAGCGSSATTGSSGPGADPATLVPSTTPLYIEAVVRPDGSLRDGATAALGKLLATGDPGAKITALLDRSSGSSDVTWEDLKPWLGKRVGVFLTSIGSAHTQGAVIADTTDTGKAQASLGQIVRRSAARSHGSPAGQSYRGVGLQVDPKGDVAAGVVDGYALLGSVSGVHQAIDVARGGRPLTDVADYTAARSAVGADQSLGVAYVVPQSVIDALATTSGSAAAVSPLRNPQTLALLRQAMARAGRVIVASLRADAGAVRLDLASIGAPASSASTAGADALAALPSDAWLGLGAGDLGTGLTRGLAQIGQLARFSSGSVDVAGLLARFKARTGIDLQRDFFSWMGSGAVYARGTGLADIGGVLTITSTNPAKSHRAVALLGRGLRRAGAQVQAATVPGYDTAIEVRSTRVPVSLFVAAGGNRFSLGINPQALTDVLHPSSTLGSSPAYRDATKALGGDLKPIFLLDTPTIVNLLESFGITAQPAFAKAKPILDALGPIAVGSARDGDITRISVALGLR
ncbi:MAG: hypothetical protein QOF12_1708 [Solirubrobacteraceae bacterium]|nr:hypothetical protein [Solirubrobacteraceae bacterium]